MARSRRSMSDTLESAGAIGAAVAFLLSLVAISIAAPILLLLGLWLMGLPMDLTSGKTLAGILLVILAFSIK